MVDYFTAKELISLEYLIISASIGNTGICTNVARSGGALYPTTDALSGYIESGGTDTDQLKRAYIDELKITKNILYDLIIKPILLYRHNIVLVCQEREDIYIDIMTEYLRKEFALPCIDLNRLFTTGETDIFYIDRKLVQNNTVELKREAVRNLRQRMESHPGGKIDMIYNHMNRDDKIKKLRELGVHVKKSDYDRLNDLLEEAWLEE